MELGKLREDDVVDEDIEKILALKLVLRRNMIYWVGTTMTMVSIR